MPCTEDKTRLLNVLFPVLPYTAEQCLSVLCFFALFYTYLFSAYLLADYSIPTITAIEPTQYLKDADT